MKTGKVVLINLGFAGTPPQVLDAPLGLSYIGAYLRQHGHRVSAIDLSVEKRPLRSLLKVPDCDNDLVGIGFVTCNHDSVPSTSRIARVANPNCWVVAGGPHATFCAKEILLRDPETDIVVIGEGEETFLQILMAKLHNKDVASIRGIAFRKQGRVFFTRKRPLIRNIDRIPKPARELFAYERYVQRHIVTSRGCPFRCVFCISPSMWGRKIRMRSMYCVFDELKCQLSRGHRRIFIADDNFAINEERVVTFCDLVQKHGLHFSWGCLSRVDSLTKDVVNSIAAAGCVEVSLGCESGSSKVLGKIRKDISPQQILKAVALLRSVNVKSRTSWILGLPGEDQTTVEETIGIMTKALPDTVSIYSPIPYPGTELARNAAHLGMKIQRKDYSRYWSGTPKPIMLPKGLSVRNYIVLLRKVISALEKNGYVHSTLEKADLGNLVDKKVVVTEFFPSVGLHGRDVSNDGIGDTAS